MNDKEILKKKARGILLSPYDIDMSIPHEDKEGLVHKEAWVHKKDALLLMAEARQDEAERMLKKIEEIANLDCEANLVILRDEWEKYKKEASR